MDLKSYIQQCGRCEKSQNHDHYNYNNMIWQEHEF